MNRGVCFPVVHLEGFLGTLPFVTVLVSNNNTSEKMNRTEQDEKFEEFEITSTAVSH